MSNIKNLLFAGVLLLLGNFGCGAYAQTDGFVTEDIVVSDPFGVLRDPEFDATPTNSRMAWEEVPGGDLWVSDVDPDTGTWSPPDGRQFLVDSGLVEMRHTRQGPEWAYDNLDNRLVYTRWLTPDQWELYQAWQDPVTGVFETAPIIDGEGLALVQASRDIGDPFPRVIFSATNSKTGEIVQGWREIDNPATAQIFPNKSQNLAWVEGRRAITGVHPVAGVKQVFFYDCDRNVAEQLTFDSADKSYPRIWWDAELDDYFLVAVVDDKRLGIWLRNSDNSWTLANVFRPPTSIPYARKPARFVWDNASYLVYHLNTEKSGKMQNLRGTGEIWVTRLTGTGPFRHRQVNDPAIKRIKDAESFVATSTVYIYYSEILEDGRWLVHRASTGLGLQ